MIQRILDMVKRNVPLTILIVVAVVLLVGTFVMYTQWQSADKALAKAEKEETVAKSSWVAARDQYNVDKLKKQEAELKAAPDIPSKWPSPLPIINFSELLSECAAKCHVTISSVAPSSSTVSIEGTSYPSYSTVVNVTGPFVNNIIAFTGCIEEGPFTSLKAEGLKLDSTGLRWQGQFTVVIVSEK